jgi:hypothetical protein
MMSKKSGLPLLPALFAVVGAFAPMLAMLEAQESARHMEDSVELQMEINRESAQSQQRISSLARQSQDLLLEYRSVVRETEALKSYNQNLEQVVTDQQGEIQSIGRQLDGLEHTQRGVVPLMLDMIETLGQIVEADLPFRLEERQARVRDLREMMNQAEVTISEKYRRVIEAYQGELEYGRTTDTYSDTLPGTGQTVDFLRVGRTLLIYQTSDGSVTGWFNPATRVFEVLPERYRLEVRKGLAIARNETAPDLVALPVPAPEAVQ